MKTGFRLVLAFALTMLLGLGIAACGGGSDDGSTTSSGSDSDISGKVTVWDFEYESFPGYTEAIEQIDANFEKLHPDVTIERVPQPIEEYERLYRAAFTARQGPDSMMFLPSTLGVLQFSQGLEVLNDRITPEMSEELSGWETTTKDYTVDGDRYGIPIGLSGEVFYYNKKLFAKAGLPKDFEPKTWDEFREAAEKLKAAGIEPFASGNENGIENAAWFSAGWQSVNTHEQAVELAKGEIPLTDEIVTNAFEPTFMLQDAGVYGANRFSSNLFTEAPKQFINEDAAMVFGYWAVGVFWGEFDPKPGNENVGVFFPPESQYLGYEIDHVMGIPKFAKNKDAAWALIDHEASKESIDILANVGGSIPNREGVTLDADAPNPPKEILATAKTALSEGKFFPYVHIMLPGTVVIGPLSLEINEALQGRTSLESAQQAMQTEFEKTTR